MMTCPRCATEVSDQHRFCSACGQRLEGREDGEAERKPVTILFADLCQSTAAIANLDPEEAMRHLDPVIGLMRAAVGRHGGIVNREHGDGVMAMFGVPTADENHAARACLAARAIIDDGAASGLIVRVGVASGDVVVRSTGADLNDYDAVGIAAHLASRMEQLADPGTVLVTEKTARLARGLAEFTPVGPVAIRGLSAPVPVFRLIAASERPSWEVRSGNHVLTGFRGRKPELAALAECAGAARQAGGAVVLVAEAGMGKSRLTHEFMAAHGAGWQVFRASATEQTSGTPYGTAATLLRGVVEAIAATGRDQQLDHPAVRALLTPETDDGDAAWAAADPASRRARMLNALTPAVLRAAAAQPVILIIEDLHWVDPSSSQALDILVARLREAPVLLLATTRPGGRPDWAGAGGPGTAIDLPPLPEADAAAMLDELIGGDAALAGLRAEIVARAEGTPLFVEEIARALRDNEVNSVAEVPASIRALLAARIDRLPRQRRRVLQVAAVLGRRFGIAMLATVLGLPRPIVQTELAQLEAADLLRRANGTLLEPGFAFRHALTHTEAYESLLRQRRRELHARVFAELRAGGGEPTDAMLAQLASHALRAELWPEAAEYAFLAGRRANERYAWREAIGFLESALAALEHLPPLTVAERTAEAWLQLRVAAVAVGDVRRMLACLEEARRLASDGGDPLVIAQIHVRRCMGLTKLGEMAEALAAGRDALAAVRALGAPGARVTASFALGEALCYAADYAAAERVLRDDLELARGEALSGVAPGPGTPAVLYLSCLSRVMTMTGQLAEARIYAAEACAAADRLGRPFDQAESRQALGLLLLASGEHGQARAVLESALDLVRTNHSALLFPIVALALGPARLKTGDPTGARALLEEALAHAQREGLAPFATQCALALAGALLTEAPDRAHDLGAEALATARRLGLRAQEARALRVIAALHALRGETDAAARQAAEASRLAAALGMAPAADHDLVGFG